MIDPWSVNETWIEEKLGDKILTELDSPILVFKGKLNQWENSLMDDGTYRLRGIVHLTDGTTEESEISFRTNSAPYPIHDDSGCKVNPKKGHAVTTEFFISCDGWYDDDLPLSYEFRYVESVYNSVDFELGKGSCRFLPQILVKNIFFR